MKKQHVQLTPEDIQHLTDLTNKGNISGRKYKRALALLELHRGKTYTDVSHLIGFNAQTVSALAAKYRSEGLLCLNDKPRPGKPVRISGEARAKITALACSTPPEGHARWSLRLLAEKVVQLEYLDRISFAQVGRILKKTNYDPIATGSGVSEI
jgi:transposase